MKYHVRLRYSDHESIRLNREFDQLLLESVIPFVNGQVITAERNDGRSLLNMSSATEMQIFKSEAELDDISEIELASEHCTQEIIDHMRLEQAAPQAKSLLQMAFAPPTNQAFVVMKFGDRSLDSAYEMAIKPVAETFGYEARRVDEIQDSGKISDQILQEIIKSSVVVCDLSGERPNCYYEAGFAHALGKRLILTIRKGDTIHFDLAGYRFVVWETELELKQELEKRFQSIRETEKDAK